MAANVRTEMRIPTRSAPRPSVNSTAQRNSVWGSTNDIFGSTLNSQPVQKKKPPPRPPPPKINQSYVHNQKDKQKKPARPTDLLSTFFGKKKQDHPNIVQFSTQVPSTVSQSANTNGSVCLIDLSPPGSPTFTTRSSSDGVSVDSFGSDGNSNPSAFTSSGNTSQTESAFEDDFDFFGISTKKVPQNDPWQVKPMPDLLGPLEVNHNASQSTKRIGDSCFFAFNTSNHTDNQVPFSQASSKPVQSMPTIIRAKPPKPPAPKILQQKLEQKANFVGAEMKCLSKTTVPFNEPISLNLTNAWPNDLKDNPSPPMPTIPPPVPPPELLQETNGDLAASAKKEPYGIALYDFPQTHPDDLPFKEGDVVQLIRKINDDWIEGRIGNRQGMFPVNFVDIKVPLPGIPDNVVTAIYPFNGETSDDLSFEEGAKITVLSRVSQDWLYGEYGGRRGQFPVNYVNRVPHNIPSSF